MAVGSHEPRSFSGAGAAFRAPEQRQVPDEIAKSLNHSLCTQSRSPTTSHHPPLPQPPRNCGQRCKSKSARHQTVCKTLNSLLAFCETYRPYMRNKAPATRPQPLCIAGLEVKSSLMHKFNNKHVRLRATGMPSCLGKSTRYPP